MSALSLGNYLDSFSHFWYRLRNTKTKDKGTI